MTNEEIKSLKPFPFDYIKRAESGLTSSGYMIGYSRKYFTLWRVSYCPNRIMSDMWGYSFVQNIIQLPSYDEDKVREMFPNLDIDIALRGRSWHFVNSDIELFRFGKYKGERIDECEDAGYLKWYIGNIDFDYKSSRKVAEIVATRLYRLGYTFMVENEEVDYVAGETFGWWLSPVSKERRAQAKEAFANGSIDTLLSGKSMRGYNKSNCEKLDQTKDYCYCSKDGIIFVFEARFYPETYYAGSYFLPLIDGKAKRVKGKNIRITSYDKLNDNTMLVTGVVLEDAPTEEKAEN